MPLFILLEAWCLHRNYDLWLFAGLLTEKIKQCVLKPTQIQILSLSQTLAVKELEKQLKKLRRKKSNISLYYNNLREKTFQ